jgi:mono/diheme cytochrome c family protein
MTFFRVMGFSVFVLLIYTGFANILPQVQSDPPKEEEVETGSMDMGGFIAYGKKLFSGKGTCTLCHNDLGRAPNLLKMDLATAFAERLKNAKYKGKGAGTVNAKSVEAYLMESFVDPSAFVVAGFGKKGSNDTVSPMPKLDAAPLQLSGTEINALIAFLQDKGGFEPTVPLPSGDEAAAEGDDKEGEGPAETAELAIAKFGCSACHDLQGSEADTGPKLNGIGKRMDRAKLMEAILNPNAEIAKGFEADMMPADLGEQMRVSELNMIIDYLIGLE